MNNYFVEKRRQDKQALLKMHKDNPDMDDDALCAIFSLKTGYRTDTIKKMLKELKDAGVW